MFFHGIPSISLMLADAVEGLLLATVQLYSPPVVTFKVWIYVAVTVSFNTVSVPSVTVVRYLVQVTVVAGPPVEIQVRVCDSGSNVTSPDISVFPPMVLRGICQYKITPKY